MAKAKMKTSKAGDGCGPPQPERFVGGRHSTHGISAKKQKKGQHGKKTG